MRVVVFLEGQTTLRKCPNRKTVPTWISKILVPPTEQQRRTEPTSVHYLSPAAELRSSPALNKVPGVAALQLREWGLASTTCSHATVTRSVQLCTFLRERNSVSRVMYLGW